MEAFGSPEVESWQPRIDDTDYDVIRKWNRHWFWTGDWLVFEDFEAMRKEWMEVGCLPN